MEIVRVMIKSTGEHGELFEVSKTLNACSVFIDGERRCRCYSLDEIIVLEGNLDDCDVKRHL